jgi:hypothetical protein
MKQTSNKLFLHAQRAHQCAFRLRAGQTDYAFLHDACPQALSSLDFPRAFDEPEIEITAYCPGDAAFVNNADVMMQEASDASLSCEWRAAYKRFIFLNDSFQREYPRVNRTIRDQLMMLETGAPVIGNFLMPRVNTHAIYYDTRANASRVFLIRSSQAPLDLNNTVHECRLALTSLTCAQYALLASACRNLIVANSPVLTNRQNGSAWMNHVAVTAMAPSENFPGVLDTVARECDSLLDSAMLDISRGWRTRLERTVRPASTGARRSRYSSIMNNHSGALTVPIATSTVQACAARAAYAISDIGDRQGSENQLVVYAEGGAGMRSIINGLFDSEPVFRAAPANFARDFIVRCVAKSCDSARFCICHLDDGASDEICDLSFLLDKIDEIREEAETLNIKLKDTLIVTRNGSYAKA